MSRIGGVPCQLILPRMTRARIAAYGVGSPPPLQHWLNAVLLLCVSLVQGVATTLGMWLGRKARECHTHLAVPALPQAKPDIHFRNQSQTASLPLAVDAQHRGDRCCEYESTTALMVSSARSARPSNHAGVLTAPSLSFRAKAQRAADPEPRSHNHRRRDPRPPASGSRLCASGMTPLVCQRT